MLPLMWDCLDLDIVPAQSLLSLPQSALARNQCSLPAISARFPQSVLSLLGTPKRLPKLSFYQLFGLISESAQRSFTETRSPKTSIFLYFSLFFSMLLYFSLLLSTLELLAGQFGVFKASLQKPADDASERKGPTPKSVSCCIIWLTRANLQFAFFNFHFAIPFSSCNPLLIPIHPRRTPLEPRRPFARNCELAFKRQACLPYQSVVEQPAQDCDPVRHAARRVE